MKYKIKLIKTLIPIIIFYILSYIIIFISSFIYSLYNNDINIFVNNYLPYILIIYYILLTIYIINKYKYSNKKTNLNKSFLSIYLGISLSIFLNMLIFIIEPPSKKITIPILTSIISSAIVGPILEEYLFRYYLYNKLKEFNSSEKTIILNSLIFGIIHIKPLNILYASILGLVINLIYRKYQNIYYCQFIHMGANFIAIFLTKYSLLLLVISLINFIICMVMLTNDKIIRATLHL